MPNTIEQVVAYAVAHPKRDGRSWSAWCESFVFRAGGFTQSFSTALAAGNASGPLNPDWTKAPRGAIHHWAGVYINGVECGHTCFELGGGELLMASSRVSTYGTGLGVIHFTKYGLPRYRGWTMRHGTQTLATSGLAGGGTKPLPEIGNDMPLNADDIKQINTIGANIVQQVKDAIGPRVWAHPLTHKDGIKGPASEWVVNMSDMVAAGTATSLAAEIARLVVADLPANGVTAEQIVNALVKRLAS